MDFTEARDNEWQWHQPGHLQVCISLQTDNQYSNPHSPYPPTIELNFVSKGGTLKIPPLMQFCCLANTHTHPFYGPFSGTSLAVA